MSAEQNGLRIMLENKGPVLILVRIRSSETSGTIQRTTRRHIPEEDTLQNLRCENLKSYTDDNQFAYQENVLLVVLQ
jgi:hypothetical protein